MKIEQFFKPLSEVLNTMTCDEQIEAINSLKIFLHNHGPFSDEPVDCVLWIKAEKVLANDYNPNIIAASEKRLLLTSINKDGYTQPVVVCQEKGQYIVVDGFHRTLLGKENKLLNNRLKNHLPVACIRDSQTEKSDRIAATIRHNRARGKHQIMAMSDIVKDLTNLGWKDEQIAKELGMDADEVLRLKQITGLIELFIDSDFSEAWTVE
ncbi:MULTISPECIES: IbrB-like domain-containing protein [Enterobacteriaceae]|uniref:IbrB-like domain-containing protein n=1 Tax=Enterobacteriaceae TaxID=543 RepID=UPI0005AA1E7C|nr:MULTISPECIES: ParB/RepB/Spo0J family partition protein [Enterobacteriaceae]